MYQIIDDILQNSFENKSIAYNLAKAMANYVLEETELYNKENGGFKTEPIDYHDPNSPFNSLWLCLLHNQELASCIDLNEYEGSLHANFMQEGTSNGPHCHEEISDKVLIYYPYPFEYDKEDGGELVVYDGVPDEIRKEGIYFICSQEGLYNPLPIEFKFDRAILMDSSLYHSVNEYKGNGRISIVWDLVRK